MKPFSFPSGDDGFYSPQHRDHYLAVAEGGPGMLIIQATDVAGVKEAGGMWTPGSKKILGEIAAGLTRLGVVGIMQLACGDTDINALTTQEIVDKGSELAAATQVAGELGFAGVEYHFAHGFYLSRLLDGGENRRQDAYGGSIENRTRIVRDLLPEIRRQGGENFILGLRMGTEIPTLSEGLAAAKLLAAAGIDFLDISFGLDKPRTAPPASFPFEAITYAGWLVKQAVEVPVIGVFGLRSAAAVNQLLASDYADLAGVGRGFLADPLFARHVLQGETLAPCRDCPECAWFTDHRRCPARHWD
jgi:2,4-dienoyl-CoA reductase-like NADH-dependent reductase (Old Yellow Enzyme family)